MFTVHCPTHGTDVLLSERRIQSIVAVDDGHEVNWQCWCGTEGTTVVNRKPTLQLVGRHRPAV